MASAEAGCPCVKLTTGGGQVRSGAQMEVGGAGVSRLQGSIGDISFELDFVDACMRESPSPQLIIALVIHTCSRQARQGVRG